MAPINNLTSIIDGILLLLVMHIVAVVTIIFLGLILRFVIDERSVVLLVYIAVIGIPLIQLIYVIPVVFKLKQSQEWGLMKGVIIGAVLTVLLSGGCWLLFS